MRGSDPVSGQVGERQFDRLPALFVRWLRDHRPDGFARRLPENPVRRSSFVPINLSARRLAACHGDAGQLQGARIGHANVPIHAVHIYGVARADFIQVPTRWNRFHRPERLIPTRAYNPFSRSSRFDFGADTLAEFIQRFRANQIDAELLLPRVSQMHVSVIKSWHHKTSTQVDDLGVRAFGLQNFIARSDRENAITADGDRLGTFSSDHRCGVDDSGINVPVDEDGVGLGLLGGVLRRHARGYD